MHKMRYVREMSQVRDQMNEDHAISYINCPESSREPLSSLRGALWSEPNQWVVLTAVSFHLIFTPCHLLEEKEDGERCPCVHASTVTQPDTESCCHNW